MINLIENINLNINYWLINWGYLNGYLQEGEIVTTSYSFIYQLLVIIILIINIIRFGFLLLNGKESQISIVLGDWGYFLGPRVIINGLCWLVCIFILMVIMFFKICTQNLKKMFYWLFIMKYDPENRCFSNIELNDSDSKMFIQRFLLFINAFKYFVILFIPLFVFANFISVFLHTNNYYLNHLIGIMTYVPALYYDCGYVFGMPIILYLVSFKLIFNN